MTVETQPASKPSLAAPSRAGQAARLLGRSLGAVLLGVAQCVLSLTVVVVVLLGALAWRLSDRPLDVAWLARAAAGALGTVDGATGTARPTPLARAPVRIGGAALAWGGWRAGPDASLTVRATGLAALDESGAAAASVASAELSLSPGWLLAGRVVARALDVSGARLRVLRAADGSTAVDLGRLGIRPRPTPAGAKAADRDDTLRNLLDEMTHPPQDDRGAAASPWAQLRRAGVHDVQIQVADRQLGRDWSMPALALDVRRRDAGGLEGEGQARLTLDDQTLTIDLAAAPAADGLGSDVTARLAAFIPAALAGKAPGLAPLAALDAPLTLAAHAGLDHVLRPRSLALHADIGGGTIHAGVGTMPVLSAAADARLSPEGGIEAELLSLVTAPRADAPRTTLRGKMRARASGPGYTATVTVDLDQAGFADLAAIWPEGVGGPGTRPWITGNITAGQAHNLHVEAGLTVPGDFSDVVLDRVSGGGDASDLTVHWLKPVPPVEHADGRLTFIDPETLEVAILSGRQAGGTHGGITAKRGLIHITGLADKDQYADISVDLAGPVADVLALLKHPRIKLLDRRPMAMRDPGGKFDGKLTVNHLAFRNDVSMDDLQIHAATRLTEVHLGGIAAGRDIDRGTLDLDAGNDGLTVRGDARVAGLPTQLTVAMDFRTGPPSQVMLRVAATATADEAQLAALGADPSGIVAGPVALKLGYLTKRDGGGEISLHADLARTAVTLARGRVRKAAGAPATADLHATLDHDRLAAIDRVMVQGDGILVDGAADVADGKPNVLKLRRVKLGDTTDAHGEIRLPLHDGDAYGLDLSGPSLDLSNEFGHAGRDGATDAKSKPPADTADKPGADKPGDAKPGPAYAATVRFDRVLVADGQTLSDVAGHVENDGRIIRRARIDGRIGAGAPFRASIEPSGGGRTLAASAADLGALLRALDVVADVSGGRMTVSGRFDDSRADHALSGNADLAEFRIRGAAALGKILQGLTLYGLVDVLSGPGLNFDRLAGAFRYADHKLDLSDARAYSSSLGLTAKGRVDLGGDSLDLSGTVVPAYFLNSLLGRIPLLGRVFSPERGGGIVAVNYTLRGSLDDPSVGVNPLSALTPGFLRGFFDVFDRVPGGAVAGTVRGGRE